MQKFIQKEKNNRLIALKSEDTRLILKSIYKNANLINNLKWNAFLKLNCLSKKSIKTRLINRCILTGRKGRFTCRYKFSRLIFLKLIRESSVSGLKKSVW